VVWNVIDFKDGGAGVAIIWDPHDNDLLVAH